MLKYYPETTRDFPCLRVNASIKVTMYCQYMPVKSLKMGPKKTHHFSEPCKDLKSCSVSWSPHYLPLNWYQIKPYCLGGKNKRRLKSDPCIWNKEGSCKVWPGFQCNMLSAIIRDMTCPKGSGLVYKPESFITKPLTFIPVVVDIVTVV